MPCLTPPLNYKKNTYLDSDLVLSKSAHAARKDSVVDFTDSSKLLDFGKDISHNDRNPFV